MKELTILCILILKRMGTVNNGLAKKKKTSKDKKCDPELQGTNPRSHLLLESCICVVGYQKRTPMVWTLMGEKL